MYLTTKLLESQMYMFKFTHMEATMRSWSRISILFCLLLLVSNSVYAKPDLSLFRPLPDKAIDADRTITDIKIQLGKKLYFEKRLSLDKSMSCNTCHNLDTFGVDNKATSPGVKGEFGDRNSPTVFNAALHLAQFWDGRAKDVEEQALGPILNPIEMAMPDEESVVKRLEADKEYTQLFAKAFPKDKKPLTYKNIGEAIGAFERTLLTPSRFDDYLKGDEKALTALEIKGLQAFTENGCTACHSGATLGGNLYQKLGIVKPFKTEDLGRFKVTKKEADKFVFKVPSLRNIEKTGPYFHDGSVKTLPEAVKLMAKHQLGKELNEDQVNSIVAFLRALTGEVKY